MGDWPLADESQGTKDVPSHAKLRRADPDMLRVTFRRCHNFTHGNEGMSKDVAFWPQPVSGFRVFPTKSAESLQQSWHLIIRLFHNRLPARNGPGGGDVHADVPVRVVIPEPVGSPRVCRVHAHVPVLYKLIAFLEPLGAGTSLGRLLPA